MSRKTDAASVDTQTVDAWVREWGEVVNKTQAAKMLGLSRRQVNRLVEQGALKTAFDGRVLVRPAAELYNSGGHDRPKTRGYQPKRSTVPRFIP